MVPQRVSLLTIGALRLPELRRFYQRLGWLEKESSSDQYAIFKTAGVLLTLFPLEELAKDAGVELQNPMEGYRGATFAINVNTLEDVDAVMEKSKKQAGRLLERQAMPFGAEEQLILPIQKIISGKLLGILILYLMKEEQ